MCCRGGGGGEGSVNVHRIGKYRKFMGVYEGREEVSDISYYRICYGVEP